MAAIFEGESCVEVWSAAANHLVAAGGSDEHLLVVINDPLQFDEAWLTRFTASAVRGSADAIRDVMNTVFPQKTWNNSADRDAFYARYKRAHSRSSNKRWGTYFLRLVSFGEQEENQLENIVHALTTWKNNPKAALTIHLSSAETDSLRPLGAPCWHYGEVLCPDKDSVQLVAVYRNHDYFNKALGNFIGLARLLKFLADETNRQATRLVCHSVRGYYDATKGEMTQLLAR